MTCVVPGCCILESKAVTSQWKPRLTFATSKKTSFTCHLQGDPCITSTIKLHSLLKNIVFTRSRREFNLKVTFGLLYELPFPLILIVRKNRFKKWKTYAGWMLLRQYTIEWIPLVLLFWGLAGNTFKHNTFTVRKIFRNKEFLSTPKLRLPWKRVHQDDSNDTPQPMWVEPCQNLYCGLGLSRLILIHS